MILPQPNLNIGLIRASRASIFDNRLTPSFLQTLDAKGDIVSGGDLTDLCNLTRQTHIFIPLSTAEPRLHYSLLIVSMLDARAFHYDPLWPKNHELALRVTKQFSDAVKVLHFHEADTPELQNEYGNDSGPYVCIVMRHLLRRLLVPKGQPVSMDMGSKMVDEEGARLEIMRTIEELRVGE